MSSCFTTIDPATGEVTHNFTGNVTIDLTSASNGGAGYVAPTCNDPPPATVTEQLPSFTVHTSLSSSPVAAPELSIPEPGTFALLLFGILALMGRRHQGAAQTARAPHAGAIGVWTRCPGNAPVFPTGDLD